MPPHSLVVGLNSSSISLIAEINKLAESISNNSKRIEVAALDSFNYVNYRLIGFMKMKAINQALQPQKTNIKAKKRKQARSNPGKKS